MKKMSMLSSLSLLLILVQMSSCRKNADLADNGSLSLTTAENASTPDLSLCKLRSILQDYGGIKNTGNFTYANGNPVKVIYDINGTGSPNHYFFYDKNKRLVEYRLTYQDGSIVAEKHRYGYVNGKRTQDTLTLYEGGIVRFVSTLTYDNQGRIIKESKKNTRNDQGVLQPTTNKTFTYDNQGNLGVLGWPASKYDNKICPLRTHEIFQFIMRNYSQNNPAVQKRYNSIGLPTALETVNYKFFNGGPTYNLVYDCQ